MIPVKETITSSHEVFTCCAEFQQICENEQYF